jgi:hypothetical protein
MPGQHLVDLKLRYRTPKFFEMLACRIDPTRGNALNK